MADGVTASKSAPALFRIRRRAGTAFAPRRSAVGGYALAACLTVFGFVLFVQGSFIPAKAVVAQFLLERAWERALEGETAPRAWPWADSWPVASVSFPRTGERQIVLAEAGGEAMAFGPAHLSRSARPGAPGVAVFAAHRDTHFRMLQHVETGERILVQSPDGAEYAYIVTGMEVVRHDRSGIIVDGGPARLALVTCYPFNQTTPGPLRYVVWAELELAAGA